MELVEYKHEIRKSRDQKPYAYGAIYVVALHLLLNS